MDKSTAIHIIEDTFNQKFDEGRFEFFAKNFLNDLEPRSNSYSGQYIWDDYKEHVNTYKRIGKYTDPDGEDLDVLIVEVNSVTKLERARTTLRNFVIKHLVKFGKDFALVAFYSKQDNGCDWRFSFIKLEHQSYLDEEKGRVKTRKEFTPAKRYSFLVGQYEKSYTAKNQLLPLLQNVNNNPTIEEIESAFSIEKVTDEFFNQYKDLFVKLYEHFDNDYAIQVELKKSKIDTSRFTKKLLGQIVFLYFLQKKGWMGVPKDKTWGNGQKRFIQELFDTSKAENQNFFRDYLQYLFYEALAKERDNENSYYQRFDCRIPFLNGGLFEAEYEWRTANISIPETLFRNEEKNKAGDIGTGILDVFDRYNFTIKEDEPLDKEVAVDPEMLGKVFENMLEITERKSKGAFYTPREIVHYMCQESLIHYLDNSLNNYTESFQEIGNSQTNMFGNEGKKGQHIINLSHQDIKVPKTDIEHFIRNGHFALEHDQRVVNKGKETAEYKYILPESIRQHADLIDKKLTDIKICDPAIGSGAFPVGLLHELVNAHLVIKPHLSETYLNKKLQAIKGDNNGHELSESRYVYRLKRHIIQESIYGVDIDASAIDIARLRLWLSLVVDEDDFEPIETLPNLDYKIVCGNSLIGFPENWKSPAFDKIELLKEKFFNESNHDNKKEFKKLIDNEIQERLNSSERVFGYEIDFDFKLFFSEVWHEKGGFDIVIGNPPYVSNWSLSKDNREIVLLLDKLYKDFLVGHWDIFLCFIPKAVNILKQKGVCSFILPTSFFKEKHSTKVREYFINELKILELLDFEEDVIFEDVARQTGIFIVRKEKTESNFTKIKNGIVLDERLVEQGFFKALKNYAFKLAVSKYDISIFNSIIKDTSKLGYHVCINTGVVAHSKLGSSKVFKKDDVIFDFYKEGFKPYVIGSNISRYKIKFENNFIDYDSNVDNFHRPKYRLLFESPKIIVRRISGKNNTMMTCYDENKYYSNDNLMHLVHWTNELLKFQKPEKKWAIKIKSDLSLKYIQSILTSDVITYYFSKFLSTDTLQGTYSSIYPEDLRELPIKPLSPKEQTVFVSFVDYLLFLNCNGTNSVLLSYFDGLLNGCVYEIYFPALIKSANKEILKHLGDLKPITEAMSNEEKLAVIQSEFERLYDPNHPVRNNLETLDSIEEVRIIKEALK